MTRSLRSSRRPCCASSASARPRSASSERSWNSSNRTAATPSSAGSARIMRVNTPSVTTSMRVRFETRLVSRTRRPIVSPTFSPSVAAIRAAAAARAARRRGSSRMRRLPFAHGSSMSASGARVVLPAPGGATSTALRCGASAEPSARARRRSAAARPRSFRFLRKQGLAQSCGPLAPCQDHRPTSTTEEPRWRRHRSASRA